MPSSSRAASASPASRRRPTGARGTTEQLSDELASSNWAFLVRSTAARAVPDRGASVVADLPCFWQGIRDVVLVLARRTTAEGEWLHVRLPIRPNGSTGWIPREAADELRVVRRALVVDLSALTARLLRDGSEELWAGPIGIGSPAWPTPTGRFYIRARYVPPPDDPLYGSFLFRTSGCVSSPPWPGADHVAIHGTNRPDLVPGRVSKGCIRVHDEDVLKLRRLLPMGAPVRIV